MRCHRIGRRGKAVGFSIFFGGKFSHLRFILPRLPRTARYVEPYGGSMAVLLNRAPCEVETYNDLDSEVVNFFRMLRMNGDELIWNLKLTPYSREEFANACDKLPGLSEMERARRFYVRMIQSRGGTGVSEREMAGSWMQHTETTVNGMAKSTSQWTQQTIGDLSKGWNSTVTHTRADMASRCSQWLSGVPHLTLVMERILRVQIENLPALDVIRKYDTSDTLHYCDPPYAHESRTGGNNAYKHEMTNRDHERMVEVLERVDGWVAVSGYDCPLYDRLFKLVEQGGKWHKSTDKLKHRPSANHSVALKGQNSEKRQEVLWTNYDPITFARNSPRVTVPISLLD